MPSVTYLSACKASRETFFSDSGRASVGGSSAAFCQVRAGRQKGVSKVALIEEAAIIMHGTHVHR